MKTAAVAIDKWKLAIFKKQLADAGYSFEKKDGVTEDSWLLVVENDDVARLANVIQHANDACHRSKMH